MCLFDWFTVSEPLGGRMVLFLKHHIQNSTCCHDNTSQNFPPCVWRREVVSELAEFVHYQTRNGIGKNLVKSIQMSDFTQTVTLTSITHEHTSVHPWLCFRQVWRIQNSTRLLVQKDISVTHKTLHRLLWRFISQFCLCLAFHQK